MERLVVVAGGATTSDETIRPLRSPRRSVSRTGVNAADPLNRRTRTRPDHNRVRDAPSAVSVLGLAPPPPAH
jgi:hypothetical protein